MHHMSHSMRCIALSYCTRKQMQAVSSNDMIPMSAMSRTGLIEADLYLVPYFSCVRTGAFDPGILGSDTD